MVVEYCRLPKATNHCSDIRPKRDDFEFTKTQYEKMGIKIIDEYDDLFWNVQLPDGWKIEATTHPLWNDLIDDKGSCFVHLISMNHLLRFIVFDDRHNRFAQFLQYDLIIEFHYFQPLFVFLVLVQFVLVQHRSFHVYDMFLSIGSGAFHVIGTHFQTNAIGIIRTCST